MFQNSLRKAFSVGILLFFLWLVLRYLLPILLPFLLGGLLALAAEPLVRFGEVKGRLPRAVATGLGVTVALLLFLLSLWAFCTLVLKELRALAEVAPNLEETASQGLTSLEHWLLQLSAKAPDSISPLLNRSIEGIFSTDRSLSDQLTSRLPTLLTGLMSKIPESLLGIGTWLLASYMISAKLPPMRHWIRTHLPESWTQQWLPMLRHLKKSLLGWLLAQCKLMALTFLVLTLCFFALQISYGPIWALLIAFVDALPILGSGTVLLPWSLICFLQGDSVLAIGLLGAYAAAVTLRSIAEPRLVGKQLGLDPLITLGAMYTGYRLLGIGGMIASPLLAVTVTQILAVRRENV